MQLPLFPLGLIVFPGERVNLHIFEPRYRQLIADTETSGAVFGMPTVLNGSLCAVGTDVRLSEVVKRYDSGESDIRVTGDRIFRITHFEREMEGKMYPGGEVEYLSVDDRESEAMNREILSLARRIFEQMDIRFTFTEIDAGFRTYDIAHHIGLTVEQEYYFLTLLEARPRQQYLLDHLQKVAPQLESGKIIRERAKQNGHFRHLRPPDF